eukprot:TRINITY_DN15727_c0_g1_i1.p1 TRINITY_DN15727_c0_g1~~TRINITY_DN15727_c0_g1_i1.p1  ORF type:complete len:660 (-),score=56.42 TRINITY_DN15727_c0_g1_i1:134-2113(-)
MTAKLFGYLRFPSKIFEIDAANDENNEFNKEMMKMLDKDPTLARNNEFMEQNNTYASIPPFPIFYNTRAQTSLLRSVFMCLQENNTNETFLECSFDHYNCKLTRIEHFLRDVHTLFNPVTTKSKKKQSPEISWMTETYVQRFYNKSMSFKEFGDSLSMLFDFKTRTSLEMVTLCWKTYNRETFHKLSENSLVAQIEEENLRKLFEIFTHLDNSMMCRLSPFIMNQFITWWISESGIKPIKELQNLAEWYEMSRDDYHIEFPEFIRQIHRLFLSGVPFHIYKTLILDAWDSIVSGIIKKGVLEKVGPHKGRWLPRVMHLHMDRIEYFKKRTDGSLEQKGNIYLGPKASAIEIFSEDKIGYFQMAVVCSESMRRFLLRCDDQRIRHSWVTSIQNVLNVMKGSQKPVSLEKPLKFIEDTKGDLVKLRSATEINGINTLDGKQIVFNKRHSDDFTKHFNIRFSPPITRRTSSFSKLTPPLNNYNRESVSSKASTMSGCMDLTTSPHPGEDVRFFSKPPNIELMSEQIRSPDGGDCSDEYESMSSNSLTSSRIEPIKAADSLSLEFEEEKLLIPQIVPLPRNTTIESNLSSYSIADCLQELTSSNILDIPAPVPMPRKKLDTNPVPFTCLDCPSIPPRRLPQAPIRLSSRRRIYENTDMMLNKL